MTFFAFGLIFLSLFLHVAWNALSKKDEPSVSFFAYMAFWATLACLPFLLATPVDFLTFPVRFWWLFGVSVVGQFLYMYALSRGYSCAGISLFYPLVRSLPVAMLAVGSLFLPLGRKVPSNVALVGMMILTLGCVIMNWPRKSSASGESGASERRNSLQVWLWVLVGALGTCLYTALDNAAMGLSRGLALENHLPWGIREAMAYLCLIECGLFLIQLPWVAISGKERQLFRRMWRDPKPLMAGVFSGACYGMVLLAMPHATNAAMVHAFRQMGLPLGFVAGVVLMHEPFSKTKIIGLFGIVAGLAMTLWP